MAEGSYKMSPTLLSILGEEHKGPLTPVEYSHHPLFEVRPCILLPNVMQIPSQFPEGAEHREQEDKSSTESALESSLSPV